MDALIQLKASYPERILAVRYETIAEQPVATFRRIYNFIGLEFTEAIAEFIYGKMFSKKDGGAFETYRSDPFGKLKKKEGGGGGGGEIEKVLNDLLK